MPIFVSASTPNPAPPIEMTSADGRLEGKFVSSRAGVLLRANFTDIDLMAHRFETNVEGFVGLLGANVTRESVSPLAGTGALRAEWATVGVHGISRSYTDDVAVVGPRQIRLKMKLTTPINTVGKELTVVFSDRLGKFGTRPLNWPVGGLNRDWFVDVFVPAGRQISNLTVTWNAISPSGWMIFDDIVYVDRAPSTVRFSRVDAGPVRGGDPAQAPGGAAYAYDDELIPGTVMNWYAEPIYPGGVIGPPTKRVFFEIPDRTAAQPSTIIKSLEDPDNSVACRLIMPEIEWSRPASVIGLQQGGLPVGGVDGDYSYSGSWTFVTTEAEDIKRMESVLRELVIYVQIATRFHIPPFYAIPYGIKRKSFAVMASDEMTWEVTLQQIERPSTLQQPVKLPGRTYVPDLAGDFNSYYEMSLNDRTYRDLIWEQN